MAKRFAFEPTVGAKVLYDDQVWTVWAQAPGVGKWWLVPFSTERSEPPSQSEAVNVSARLMAAWRG